MHYALWRQLMMSVSFFAIVSIGASEVAAMSKQTGASPTAANADESPFLICAAGVPNALFGPEDAPRFEEVFTALSESGFTAFFPDFSQTETDTEVRVFPHSDYFYELDADSPRYAGGEHSPYRAARGRLQILLPGYVFVPAQEWSSGIDEEKLRETFTRFMNEVLGGDISVLAGIDNFDEPVSKMTGARWSDNDAPVGHTTLRQFYETSKLVFPGLPVYMIEGCVATAFDHLASYSEYMVPRPKVKEDFWQDVERASKAADWYGFDLYPVPQLEDLALVGDNVRAFRARVPDKPILAVLQGFGEKDLGREGRRPTPEETRFMTYDAIINGADGIVWWGQSAMDISDDNTLWMAIQNIAKEISQLNVIRGLPEIDLAYANSRMETLARQGLDTAYILAANTSGESQPFAFHIPFHTKQSPEFVCYELVDFFSGEKLGSGRIEEEKQPIVAQSMGLANGVWKEQVPPHGVRVYKVKYSKEL